ncbi:hypothetical protein [Solimicrobium silvestre]|uniref:DUF2493 domain-containing protein n=1 Tax=Solimicrobium silvestre TaxID=2099400 RepID=A0A2S9GX66_9BURK|nr:hypothetical protein [Solimicrobium silvestre]PRC92309.1 hypothetical protein S2091_2968 [Solimicrobium silvestre]
MRVLITGSTTWTDIKALRREFAFLPKETIIITGDTSGVDAFANEVAPEFGFVVELMKKTKEDYETYPDNGWKGLNDRMIRTGIDLLLAFHPEYGKPGLALGTRHAVELAEQAGIQVIIFYK